MCEGGSPRSSSGPPGALAQLGVGEVKVVLLLEHMIGEFVAQGEADAQNGAVVADHVTAHQFGLFAALKGKGRHGQRLSGGHEPAAIALIEPLRRDAHLAGRGFAAFQAQTKHAH